jgi:hypothetical protein
MGAAFSTGNAPVLGLGIISHQSINEAAPICKQAQTLAYQPPDLWLFFGH